MVSKLELRLHFKSLLESRRDLSDIEKKQDSENFSQQLTKFFKDRRGSWAAFHPMASEPSITDSLGHMTHVDWYYPRVRDESLEFLKSSCGTRKHRLGFLEPVDGDIKTAQELDGFLIPGLAFDRQGRRLGRGGGYYDRSLEKTSGVRVGICFNLQLVEKLEATEDHDVAMDFILTEAEAVTCESRLKGS